MEALHIHYSVQETECCKVSRDLWVIAQRELTSDYGGSDRSLLRFLLLLSTRFLFVSSAAPSICSETTPRTRDCITAAVWSDGRWWVCLRGCRQGWQTACVSCVTAALDHGQPCLVGRGFSLCYGPPGTAVGFTRKVKWGMRQAEEEEEEGGGSEVGWPADNTWQETDRFDMRTCPHLCSGKRDTGLAAADGVSKYSHPTLLKSNTLQTEFQQCT